MRDPDTLVRLGTALEACKVCAENAYSNGFWRGLAYGALLVWLVDLVLVAAKAAVAGLTLWAVAVPQDHHENSDPAPAQYAMPDQSTY